MDKITGKIMGGMTGFAKKVTINLVYEFIDQRTKEIKDELKEHKLENNQQFEKLEYKTKQIAETASTLGVNQIEVLQRTHEELRKSIKKIQEIIEKQQSDLAARRWNLICKKYDESLSKEEEEELDSLDKRAADLRTSSTDYGTMKQKFNQWDKRARRLETPF